MKKIIKTPVKVLTTSIQMLALHQILVLPETKKKLSKLVEITEIIEFCYQL